jgi:hypothetical protein
MAATGCPRIVFKPQANLSTEALREKLTGYVRKKSSYFLDWGAARRMPCSRRALRRRW